MKILLVHASAGSGHLKAAEAIFNDLKDEGKHDLVFLDGLDKAHPFFKKMYRDTYASLITYVPTLWAFFFWLLDIEFLQGFIRGFRRIYNSLNFGGLQKYLIEEDFDVIISAHFMCNEVAGAMKKNGKIRSKIISVVTDYKVHRIWLADCIDKYCVACEVTKSVLLNLGVRDEKIVVTGIPSDKRFSQAYDLTELKTKVGIKPNMFTVLIATGSFGIGPIEAIVRHLKGVQTIVVCGHNEKLYARLNEEMYPDVIVCGLVDNMFELMAVSDVMITKPGGLSITEAMVSQLPLIFFNAIPGQESNNVEVLQQYGIGITDCTIEEIADEVQRLAGSSDTLKTARNRSRELARPSAVKDIISLLN